MRITDKYVIFSGGKLSNWATTPYKVSGKEFVSSEQEYHYQKALHFGDERIAQEIYEARCPETTKALSRHITDFDQQEWDRVKYKVMEDVCRHKYFLNEKARKVLLSYPDKEFVEASAFDRDWGCGLDITNKDITDPTKWTGKNNLGRILTKVRDDLSFNLFL